MPTVTHPRNECLTLVRKHARFHAQMESVRTVSLIPLAGFGENGREP